MRRHAVLTHHARDVMARRGVSMNAVYAVLHAPEVSSVTTRGTLRSRGRLTVVTADYADRHVVVTVLLKTEERWTDAEARAVLAGM